MTDSARSRRRTTGSDSRRLWLPLQLALTPDEHDDQTGINALIARAIGRPFLRVQLSPYGSVRGVPSLSVDFPSFNV